MTCSKLFIVCALESVLTGLRSLSSDPDYRCLGHPFVDGFLAECLGNAYELACLRIDQEALYGNLKFDPRSESSYWQVDEEGQKLYYNWWKVHTYIHKCIHMYTLYMHMCIYLRMYFTCICICIIEQHRAQERLL